MAKSGANMEQLDKEWILLMKEAMQLGIKKEDIQRFLIQEKALLEEISQG